MADGVKKINEYIMKDGRTIIVTLDNIAANKLEGGTAKILPTTGALKYVNINGSGTKEWKNFNPVTIFDPKSITTSLLADYCVTDIKIAQNAVITSKIKNLNVTREKINDLAVNEDKIDNLAVKTGKLDNSAVTTIKIADSAVTEVKIANESVTSSKIKPGSVLNSHIALRTIRKDRILKKDITNEEIADDTITNSLMKADSILSKNIKAGEVKETNIATGAVTHYKIGQYQVYGDRIKVEGVDSDHIIKLHGSKIIDDTITNNKLCKDSVQTTQIKDLNVTMGKLETNVQTLINNAVRVVSSQSINGTTVSNAAWVKGNLYVENPTSGNVLLKVKGNIEATGDITGNRVFNPYFADLAEAYVPTEEMEAGDAVALSLEGELKIEKLTAENKDRFIGFVSNEYAQCFGATPEELKSKKKVAVTLVGRIHIAMKEDEEGKIGNYIKISSSGEIIITNIKSNDVVGRLLENKTARQKHVLCQLWP